MIAPQIADRLSTQWSTYRPSLALNLHKRYQRVLQNVPNLPPNTESHWLTLYQLHPSLIDHILMQLPSIALSPEQLLAAFNESAPDGLTFRWSKALSLTLMSQYMSITSQFLNSVSIPNSDKLPDAFQILSNGYPCVCDTLKTFRPEEIASEMNRLQPPSINSIKILCYLFSMNLVEARALILNPPTQI